MSGSTRDGTTLTEKTKAPTLCIKMSPQTSEAEWTAGWQGSHIAFSRQASDGVVVTIKNLAIGGERTTQRTCSTCWSFDGRPLPSTTCQGAQQTRQLLRSPARAVAISDRNRSNSRSQLTSSHPQPRLPNGITS